MNKNNKRGFFKPMSQALRRRAALLATALLAMGMPALASAGAIFDKPSCTDRSIADLLTPIFGSLVSDCGGSAGGPIASVMLIFNTACLTIGGIIAAYIMIVGTAQTAHDGEMLGKRWSSMWVPIRMVIGCGLVVPTASGFSVAQMLVMFLATQGVSVADKLWGQYVSTITTPAGLTPKAQLPNVNELARNMLTSLTCLEGYNDLQRIDAQIMPTPMTVTMSDGVRLYGINGGNECGSIRFDTSPADSAISNAVSKLFKIDASALNSVQKSHMSATLTMESTLRPVAAKIAQSVYGPYQAPGTAAALTSAVNAYQTTVAAAASSVFGDENAMSALISATQADGWIMAGAWFVKIAQMQDAVNRVVSQVPTASLPDGNALHGVSKDMSKIFLNLDASIKRDSQNQTALSSTVQAVSVIGESSNTPSRAAQYVSHMIFGDWVAKMVQVDKNRNSIMAIKDFGDRVMVGSEAGMGLGVVLVGASEAAKANNDSILGKVGGLLTLNTASTAIGSGAGVLQVVGYLTLFFSVALLAFGMTISIYLPLAPFLLFIGAAVSWLILVIEAVVAAPLWAIMHLTPEGDGVMGGARQGYMMLLGLLLRPALIVLGFIFAITAVDPVVLFCNSIFFSVFQMATSGSVIGLAASFAMIAIYFLLMLKIINLIFGLTHVVADKVLRWIGGGQEQLGEAANALSSTGRKGTEAISSRAGSIQDNMVRGMMTSAAIESNKRGRGEAVEREANSSTLNARAQGNAAEVDMAKAGSGRSGDQLKAVSSNIESAEKAESALDQLKSSDRANGTHRAEEQGPQLKAQSEKGEGQAKRMTESMTKRAQGSDRDLDKKSSHDQKEVAHDMDSAASANELMASRMESKAVRIQSEGGPAEAAALARVEAQSFRSTAGDLRTRASAIHKMADENPNKGKQAP